MIGATSKVIKDKPENTAIVNTLANDFKELLHKTSDNTNKATSFSWSHGNNGNTQQEKLDEELRLIAIDANTLRPDNFERLCKAKELLSAGANPNYREADHVDSALDCAAYSGNFDLVNLLLENGAELKHTGCSTIMSAALSGDFRCFEKILKLTDDKEHALKHKDDSDDYEGSTLLHYAAWGGNPEIVKELLEKGADPKALNDSNESALDWAINGGPHNDHSRRIDQKTISLLEQATK